MNAIEEIVQTMRRLGVTHLKTADGLEVDLGAVPAPPSQKKASEEGDEDLRAEAKQRREWDQFWTRANRASGAPIPPYPKRRPEIKGAL